MLAAQRLGRTFRPRRFLVSSGEAVNAIFSYDTTKAVHVDFVELDVSAEIPDIDNLPAVSYSGNITLELRFQ